MDALGINEGFLIAQIVNFVLVALTIAAPVAIVYYVIVRLRQENRSEKMMLQRTDGEHYVQVQLDDVTNVDILDGETAVVQMEGGRKINVNTKDARRMVRKLQS